TTSLLANAVSTHLLGEQLLLLAEAACLQSQPAVALIHLGRLENIASPNIGRPPQRLLPDFCGLAAACAQSLDHPRVSLTQTEIRRHVPYLAVARTWEELLGGGLCDSSVGHRACCRIQLAVITAIDWAGKHESGKLSRVR
uniref:Histidine kinase n=1 Tax=Macrostomum lignano TaxID=282301 RepID=A0A1I8FC74_9PLAT